MKVKELKELLEVFNEDLEVSVEGALSTDGFCITDVRLAQEKEFVWNVSKHADELVTVSVVHLYAPGVSDLEEQSLGESL